MERLEVDIFQVIIINYSIAFALGMVLNKGTGFSYEFGFWQAPWFPLSILIGLFFIAIFFVIGISTQKVGITATTISTRMSVVIPILFSILYYHESVDLVKVLGVVFALTALVCSMIKNQTEGIQNKYVYLPAVLFIGMGVLHAIIKFAQHEYIPDEHSAAFTGACFFFAFVSGLVISLIRQVPLSRFFQKDVLCVGIVLGTCNFGAVFFLINALNHNIFDSSVIFGIINAGIVGTSVLSAFIFFKERLSALNWAGVILSILSIILFVST